MRFSLRRRQAGLGESICGSGHKFRPLRLRQVATDQIARHLYEVIGIEVQSISVK